MYLRVSIGSAILLGLREGRLDAEPTTLYVMLGRGCRENCAFCAQARDVEDKGNRLSRVTWPHFETDAILEKMEQPPAKRVCIQALNYPGLVDDLAALLGNINKRTGISTSAAIPPLPEDDLRRLKEAGLERAGIALDAATAQLFDRIKGRSAGNAYSWDDHWKALELALTTFGKGSVSTHLIVGLGETDREMADALQRAHDAGILPSLFAYTPLAGTALDLPAPPLGRYRTMQFVRRVVVRGLRRAGGLAFDGSGRLTGFGYSKEELANVVADGSLFQTQGCPWCNRPFYNERPGGPLYNYPRPLTPPEVEKAVKDITDYLEGSDA